MVEKVITERQLGLLVEKWDYDGSLIETTPKNNRVEIEFYGTWIDNRQAEYDLRDLHARLVNDGNICYCDDMDPSNFEVKDLEEVADYGVTIAGFGTKTSLNNHTVVKVCKQHLVIMDSADAGEDLTTKALKRLGLK